MGTETESSDSRTGCTGIRYLILVISILVLTFAAANTLALNFTVICMYKDDGLNSTLSEAQKTPLYDPTQQSWLFSAIAFGTLIGTLPLMTFAQKWNTRWVFTVYGMISGSSMLLMPLGVYTHFAIVFVLRMMQGFGLSITFTSLGSIVNSWATLDTVGMYITLLSVFFQLGPLTVFPISGALCTSKYGWAAVYYLLGSATIASFAIFAAFYRDDASRHPCISQAEIKQIRKDRPPTSSQRLSTPYKAIFTDVVIWGAFASIFAVVLGLQFMMQYGPIYLKNVLSFDIKGTAMAAALPYILALTAKFFIGPLSDCVTCISEKTKIIMFNTIAQLPICMCFIIMATLPKDMVWLIQIVYSFVSSFSGFNTVGVFKCIQLVARQHAGFVMGMMGIITSIVMLLLPRVVQALAPDYTAQQWETVLYLMSAVIGVMIVFFNCVCQTEPRSWTKAEQPSLGLAMESVPMVENGTELPSGKERAGSIVQAC